MNVSNNTSVTYQRVEMKKSNYNYHTFSDWGVIKHGVPQGSILGSVSSVCK
jgi:hypothetical protein